MRNKSINQSDDMRFACRPVNSFLLLMFLAFHACAAIATPVAVAIAVKIRFFVCSRGLVVVVVAGGSIEALLKHFRM